MNLKKAKKYFVNSQTIFCVWEPLSFGFGSMMLNLKKTVETLRKLIKREYADLVILI